VAAHLLCGTSSQRGLSDPVKSTYSRLQPNGRLELTTSVFNRLDQFSNTLDHRTYTVIRLTNETIIFVLPLAILGPRVSCTVTIYPILTHLVLCMELFPSVPSTYHCVIIHHPHFYVPGLKPSFYANPSHLLVSLLVLLQDCLHGFPGLFTDTSEHTPFLLFTFSIFHFLVFCFLR